MLTKGNWARAGVHWLYRKMIAERFPRIALIKCHYWLLGSPPCKLARAWTQRHTHSLTKLLLLLYTSTSIYICMRKDKNPRKHSSNIFPSSSTSTRTRLLVIQRLCAVIDFQEELMRAHKVKPSFFFPFYALLHFISFHLWVFLHLVVILLLFLFPIVTYNSTLHIRRPFEVISQFHNELAAHETFPYFLPDKHAGLPCNSFVFTECFN